MSSLLPQEKVVLKEKIVIIINGKGGAGKDTVCEIAAKYYYAETISAITPVKKIACACGWNGEKDKKSRKFLSDLKRLLVDYNDFPNQYLEQEYQKFTQSGCDILFVHIREKDQIDCFRKKVSGKCVTMLVRSPRIDENGEGYGNPSDDNVEDYRYDYYFQNETQKEELEPHFLAFLNELLLNEGVIK